MAGKKKAEKTVKKGARNPQKGVRKGARLMCEDCGLVLVVGQACGCDDYSCNVACCGEQMSII